MGSSPRLTPETAKTAAVASLLGIPDNHWAFNFEPASQRPEYESHCQAGFIKNVHAGPQMLNCCAFLIGLRFPAAA